MRLRILSYVISSNSANSLAVYPSAFIWQILA
jgi:hypothetical protein